MIQVVVTVEGSPLQECQIEVVERAIRRAALEVGEMAKGLWLRRAQNLDIRRTGEYLRGIQAAPVSETEHELAGDVLTSTVEVVNTAPHASFVEDGHGAFALPHRIDWNGPKVKHGTRGPYLHIPFRHRAYQGPAARQASGATRATIAAMMPPSIYRQAKALPYYRPGHGPGQRLSRGTQPAIHVSRSGEAYEEHRSERLLAGRDRRGKQLANPAWQASKFEGLFKSGTPGHTAYMTIRTITPRSLGWRIPALHGHGVARQVAYVLQHGNAAKLVDDLVTRAILQAMGETL